MKVLAQRLSLVLVTAALFAAGCSKRTSPTPDQTSLGPGPGGLAMNPVGDGTLDSSASGLESRTALTGAQERGLVQPVLFNFDSAEVRSGEAAKVEEAARFLKENTAARVLLEGHCDWRGTTEYNIALGDRRAASVKAYLIRLGIDAARIDVLSKGDSEAQEGAGESQMARDRRVEFVILR